MKPMRFLLALLLGAFVLAGCDGDDDDSGDDDDAADTDTETTDTDTGPGELSCAQGEFKVVGEMDGNALNLSAGADGRYVVNTGDGTFVGSNDDGSSITLNWTGIIPNGQVQPVTGGSLAFAAPIGGIDEIFVVTGTIVLDDEVEFELTELSLQDGTAVSGSLSGCHHN